MDRIDKKLEKLGFKLVYDADSVICYESHNKNRHYKHRLDIVYKANGNHIIQSYQKDTNSDGFSNMIGIPYKAIKPIYKKMKKYLPRYMKYKKGKKESKRYV